MPRSNSNQYLNNRKDNDHNIESQISPDGRNARNMVSWRVPNETKINDDNIMNFSLPSSSEYAETADDDHEYPNETLSLSTVSSSDSGEEDVLDMDDMPLPEATFEDFEFENTEGFRHKLWCYLFKNMHHAVDELYLMCELESSMEYCEEAVQAIDACKEDFKTLAERLRTQSCTPVDPKAMAWEVRKNRNMETSTVVMALQMAATNVSESNTVVPDIRTDGPSGAGSRVTTSLPARHNDDDDNSPENAKILDENTREIRKVLKTSHSTPVLLYRPRLTVDTNWSSPLSSANTSPLVETTRRSLHEKLSSPDRRKRSPSETKRLHEQRFFAAKVNRGKIVDARQTRFRLAAERLKDVSDRKAQKLAQREEMMWGKLRRADALHEAHLRWIMRKADRENTKVDEVGFIKSLTAENRKASLQQRLDGVAERREQHLHQVRVKAGSFENAQTVSKRRENKIESAIAEKHAAMVKRHEDVEARRLGIQEEVKQKIVVSARKEFVVSERRKEILKDRNREICHPVVNATLPEASSVPDDENRAKTMRTKAKKLRARLSSLSPGYQETTQSLSRSASNDCISRYERYITRFHVDGAAYGPRWEGSLLQQLDTIDTALRDFVRYQVTRTKNDLHSFRRLNGVTAIVKLASRATATVNVRVTAQALKALHVCCALPSNIDYLLATNCAPELVDLMVWTLQRVENRELVDRILDIVTGLLRHTTTPEFEDIQSQMIKYIVNAGTILTMTDIFERFRSSFSAGSDAPLLIKCAEFLEALTAIAGMRKMNHPVLTMSDLTLPVTNVFKETGLMGIVSLLVSLLMESRPQRRSDSIVLSDNIQNLSVMALKVLNNVATLNFELVQATLSSGSLQQEFIHMLGFFLASCVGNNTSDILLQQVLILIGYYTLQNPSNQETMRWGNTPNLLQRLTNLPIQYFIEPTYKDILFPTLIAVCHGNFGNKRIMENDVHADMLGKYIQVRYTEHIAASSGTINDDTSNDRGVPSWMQFAQRFPVCLWKDAQLFFKEVTK